MTSPLDLLKKPLVVGILGAVAGIIIGLLWGWVIQPVKFIDATPAVLRSDLQQDYLRMAIDSFRVNRDPNLAVQRWNELGPAAVPALQAIQQDPRGIDPVVIAAYVQVIQTVNGPNLVGGSAAPQPASNAPISGLAVVYWRRPASRRTLDTAEPAASSMK